MNEEMQNYFKVINGTALYYEKYVKYLQDQLKAYENMRKEAIEYTKSHFKEMVADEEAQILLNILNKVGGSDEK